MSRVIPVAAVLCVFNLAFAAQAQEPVFSGPQPGEKVKPFKVRGVFGDLAGKEFDLVAQANGKPLAIIFIHEVTRPSLGLTRMLMDYAAKRAPDGLISGVVFLNDDVTEAENFLKRASNALPTQVPIGVSVDGREGPGAYGLNRNVALTILVAKDNVVQANFALVQPSIQADAERIAKRMAEASGGKAPTLADLGAGPDGKPVGNRNKAGGNAPLEPQLEPLLRALIQRTNDERAVRETAAAIEKLVATNAQARAQLGERTAAIVKAGKIENYGTPAAQKVIQEWAEKYRAKDESGGKKPQP